MNGMEWNGMEWMDLEWNGMEWSSTLDVCPVVSHIVIYLNMKD